MRMRELEKRTGVGRETIRYYIREGLLPEPARASRNSASYSDDHVARLKAIKRLQDERFLPLAIIKTLLDAEDGDRWLAPAAFPQLDSMLRARLDADSGRVNIDQVIAGLGHTRADLAELVNDGVIEIDSDDGITARDAAILRVLDEMRVTGFTEARGFRDGMMRVYADFIEWVTAQEMRVFFEHTAGKVDEAEALDMAERGIASINELLSLMRTRAILRKLEARRRIAND
ncbi:MAG: MerR family transcriptional regulator [Polymorphobacter sp.]